MKQSTEHKTHLAENYLRMARQEHDQAKRSRLVSVEYAREAGLTFQEIGNLLGVTEGAIRMMLRRNKGEAR